MQRLAADPKVDIVTQTLAQEVLEHRQADADAVIESLRDGDYNTGDEIQRRVLEAVRSIPNVFVPDNFCRLTIDQFSAHGEITARFTVGFQVFVPRRG